MNNMLCVGAVANAAGRTMSIAERFGVLRKKRSRLNVITALSMARRRQRVIRLARYVAVDAASNFMTKTSSTLS